MATRRPPFTWLGRHTEWISLCILLAAAIFFRFWQLIPIGHHAVLPPGLYTGEALIGLSAANLVSHGWLPGMTAANGYAPLWVVLQALPVWILGHTVTALRIWPAVLGVFAVVTTWLWASDWFGRRIGWLTAFILAITPWSVTISRNGISTALIPLLITSVLWLGTKAVRHGGIKWWAPLSIVMVACLFSGPLGWMIFAAASVMGVTVLAKRSDILVLRRDRVAAATVATIGLIAAVFTAVMSLDALRHLPSATGLTARLVAITSSTGKTLVMFNLHGDDNFRHNLAGEPMLNAFIGLMFVAGIIVAASRFHLRQYRLVLILLLVMLLPAFISTLGAPNAAHAAAALPLVAALAAVGISYMLELWYSTFPINSAARTTGQLAIIALLLLSVFHAYTQYFRAWAGSAEVYTAYNESAVGVAGFIQSTSFVGTRAVVATADELPVTSYLVNQKPPYTSLTPKTFVAFPTGTGAHQFVVTASARDEAVKNLSAKFPGGVLRPHLSSFNQAEIYYVYEVAK